ncbi:glutaredoxin family protein [Halomonas maura]|uniref:glutaredoxin family protein n=1 Tax=Halomonas maura TaxID=117606 RepID=UPI0025B3E573|nr:glutaredoxin [Halomonas maura]MDN3556490.1 glutaredoxin [Halomonas maura]
MRPSLRTLLAPVVWVANKLGTRREVSRDDAQQAEVDQACETLALYQAWSEPDCIQVRREITRLGLEIETRDVRLDPEHTRVLKEEGGKLEVPCLYIHEPQGEARWLYGAQAIIDYLRERFG